MAENNEEQVNPRIAIREAREARLKLIQGNRNPTVKVYAGDGEIFARLKHTSGMGFRGDIGEAVDWPDDAYTQRLIWEGALRTDGPGPMERTPDDPTLNPREQAAARRPKEEGEGEDKSQKDDKAKKASGEPKPAPAPQPTPPPQPQPAPPPPVPPSN